MAGKVLSVSKDDHILIVTVTGIADGREGLEALSYGLTDACDEATRDDGVHVVVLAGIEKIPPFADAAAADPDNAHLPRCAGPVAALSQPVLCAIDGAATGRGLEIALACDFTLATPSSSFGLPYIKEGLMPGEGGTQRLSRRVGKARALEMILTGEEIDAREALRIGLLSRMAGPGELMAVTLGLARTMAAKGPIALRYTKEAICQGMDLTLEQGVHLEADLYLLLHTTRDRTEGIRAFLEKRPPVFEGR